MYLFVLLIYICCLLIENVFDFICSFYVFTYIGYLMFMLICLTFLILFICFDFIKYIYYIICSFYCYLCYFICFVLCCMYLFIKNCVAYLFILLVLFIGFIAHQYLTWSGRDPQGPPTPPQGPHKGPPRDPVHIPGPPWDQLRSLISGLAGFAKRLE